MNEFELVESGDGRFELRGDMSFKTAEAILRTSRRLFHWPGKIEINLSGVQKTDAAGLALLLEWIGQARRVDGEICFVAIPAKVRAIAETADVAHLLDGSGHSASSKK